MKKVRALGLLLASVAAACALSSCGDSSDAITIRWATDSNPERGAQARLFEELNPGVKIKVDPVVGESMETKIMREFAGDGAPELFDIFSTDMLQLFARKNMLEDLSDMFAEGNEDGLSIDMFWPTLKGRMIYQGKVYGVPNNCGPFILFYDRQAFAEAGIADLPKDRAITWNELISVAKKVTKIDAGGRYERAGIAFAAVLEILRNMVWEEGGDVMTADGTRVLYNTPVVRNVYQRYIDMMYVDHVMATPVDEASAGGIASGSTTFTGDPLVGRRTAMYINGRWGLISMREDPDLDFGVALHPRGTASADGVLMSRVTGIALGTHQIEAAKKFLIYLTKREFGETINRGADGFPAVREWAVDRELMNNPAFPKEHEYSDVFVKQFDYTRIERISPYILLGQMGDIHARYFENMRLQQTDVPTGLKQMADEMNAVIDEERRAQN